MIAPLSDAQLEHIAVRAAEIGDGFVLSACNRILEDHDASEGGVTYMQWLCGTGPVYLAGSPLEVNGDYLEWLELGRDGGYLRCS